MYVATSWDDLWIAEKFQSNTDIAGSLRNAFRSGLTRTCTGGRATEYARGLRGLLNVIKLRIPEYMRVGVRLCEISLTVERETAQTYS